MSIRVCIFDLDGTLLNTLDGIAAHINAVFAEDGIAPLEVDFVREILGYGARQLISRACEARGITDKERVDDIFIRYNRRYDADLYYMVTPYPGIERLLSELSARGIKLAVLSNKPDGAVKNMVEHFFPGRFDLVLGGRDGIALKPSADGALEILKELGKDASECAFIGDGETDVITARNLTDALPIAVLWGFRGREELSLAGAEHFAACADDILTIIGG